MLTTLIENVPDLDDDEYALIRRQGLGASDSSVLLGVNPYKQKHDLIVEKRSKVITDEERAIKKKEAVRKGFDLTEKMNEVLTNTLTTQLRATLMEQAIAKAPQE